MNALQDKPYSIQATEAIANFERNQIKRRKSRERLKKIIDIQSGVISPQNLNERLVII